MDRSGSQDREEGVYISCRKVVWAGHRDELEDHPGQDVEHWSKRGVNEGYAWSTTLEGFFLFGQAFWKLTAFAGSPRIRLSILVGQLCDKGVDNCGCILLDRFEDRWIHKVFSIA